MTQDYADKALLKNPGDIAAFVELHIEQGPALEAEKKDIGIVEAIMAPSLVRVKFTGKGGHGGGMPMSYRCSSAGTKFFSEGCLDKLAGDVSDFEEQCNNLVREAYLQKCICCNHRNDPSLAASELNLVIEEAALATGSLSLTTLHNVLSTSSLRSTKNGVISCG